MSKDSDLATLGSLSFRSNIGPLMEGSGKVVSGVPDEKHSEAIKVNSVVDSDSKEAEIKDLKGELKKVKESKKILETEYLKCESELKYKTEEVEKLKIEVKDLKVLIELEQKIKDINVDDETTNIKENSPKEKDKTHGRWHAGGIEYKCTKCSFTGTNRVDLRKHIQEEHPVFEEQFNCSDCFYQGTCSDELEKHISNKHSTQNCVDCSFKGKNKSELRKHEVDKHSKKDYVRCRICGETFRSKSNLMEHRKTEHTKTVANCRNYSEGTCVYSSKMCWWNHDTESRAPDNEEFRCFICNETFPSKGNMMTHKKKEHRNAIRECNLFIDDKCRFNDESCWFNHDDGDGDLEVNETGNEETTKSVFRKVQENLEPPLKRQ